MVGAPPVAGARSARGAPRVQRGAAVSTVCRASLPCKWCRAWEAAVRRGDQADLELGRSVAFVRRCEGHSVAHAAWLGFMAMESLEAESGEALTAWLERHHGR